MAVEQLVATTSLTLLFTDIEGSTSLWVDHPDQAGRAVELHDEIISRTIAAHNGRVIKTTGDGFLASFPSPRAGVEAAIDAQVKLLGSTDELIEAAHVRMALHTGSVEERSGDLFGLAVHKAERIMSAASAGQVLVSNSAASVLRDDLPAGSELIDLGDQVLRGLPGVERVYQLAHPSLRRDFPPLATAADAPTNLPVQLTTFVGREDEIDRVESLLVQHRLVTLVGEGGAGKTRLSLEVGARTVDDFADGVWFIGLESLRDPDLVAERFASTLGLDERVDRSYVDLLVDHLTSKQVLLIVDNCEHVLTACSRVVATLLRRLSDLRILATSRQRLGVPGELSFRVPSMAVPDADATGADASRYEAVTLFVDRAALARPDFRLTDANTDAVTRIVRSLDGIPLALELAAAKTAVLSPEQIASHLDDRFGLLTSGPGADLPRHQTLRAAIDWSYELLAEGEREVFRRLSVFRGGFDLSAAESICAEATDASSVVAVVSNLVDKSMVVADVDVGRYRLLETMRQFASERLSEGRSADETGRRHAEYFVDLAERAGEGLDGPDQAEWFAVLETERDNLRAALEWSLDHEPMALRLSSAIWRFWLVRGRPAEGRDWLARVLASRSDGDEHWRVRALLGMGALESRRGDHVEAQALLDDALRLANEIDDQAAASMAMGASAVILHKEGDLPGATTLLMGALESSRRAGNDLQEARVLTNLALVLADRGDQHGAGRYASEALEASRRTGIPDVIADAMLTAAEISINNGEGDRARLLLEDALRENAATGVSDIGAWARSYLAKILLLAGDVKASRALFGEAIEVFRDIESPVGEEWALRHLALAEVRSGEVAAAAGTATEALRLAVEFVRPDVPFALQVAGQIGIEAGTPVTAAVVLAAARATGSAMDVRLPPVEAEQQDMVWESIRGVLGPEDLADAINRGDSMQIDEAVAFARAMLQSVAVSQRP